MDVDNNTGKIIRMIVSISFNVILIIVGIMLIFTAGSKAYSFGHNIFDEKSVSAKGCGREVEVTISDNVTSKELADILYGKGLVEDKTLCYFQIILSDYKNKFIDGTYILSTEMKPSDMMAIMTGEEQENTGE